MSLIPYPNQIKPARQTSMLERKDEMFVSPITGIQQTASRGNAYWRHTIEYRDLSDSERDIVQAFLMKCRGSLNTFRLPDFGNYEISGAASDWVDIFSGNGSFRNQADLDAFIVGVNADAILIVDGLNYERRNPAGSLVNKLNINSLTAGASYINRFKFFGGNDAAVMAIVGSSYHNIVGPSYVRSAGQVSAPFFAHVGSANKAGLIDTTGMTVKIGDQRHIGDMVLSRCALVSNSENLLTYSNEFDHADWSSFLMSVDSGYGDNPTGVTSGAWKLNGTGSGYHYVYQAYTKPMTEGIYNFLVNARAVEHDVLRMIIGDELGAGNQASVLFYLNSGTHNVVTNGGVFERGSARIYDVGSSWYKCSLSTLVSSSNAVRGELYINSGAGSTYDMPDSYGLEIANAQLREHPFPGHYVPTTDTIVVGSGWQTGAKLYVEGLESDAIMFKAGARFEIINRYYNDTANVYERSEFKRLTADLRTHREGWGVLEFDPPIRNAPETQRSVRYGTHLGETMHNAVVFDNPETTCRLVGNTIQYIEKPLKLTDIVFDVIEDLTV